MAMAATTGSSSSSASAAAGGGKPAPALPPLTVKLDPKKYSLWLAHIIPLLESRGLMSFVDGTAISPPAFLLDADGKPTNTTNPACENWIQMDRFVLSLINDSLSHFVVATLAGSISARATWVSLQALLVGAAEQQPLLPTPVVDNSAAAVTASRGFGFDHLVSGEEMSGGGGGGCGGATGEGVSGKKGLPGVNSFSPTDKQLVSYYLKNKILGNDSEFKDINIPVIDHVCEREPGDLPAVFFTQPDYINNKRDRCKRTTDEGKYNVTGQPLEIKDELSKTVIGKKRYLSFEYNVPDAKKTKYVIHEYSLTETELAKLVPDPNQRKEFVLCCLKIKSATSSKRKNKSATPSKKKNKSANSRKLKDDSIYGNELAEPAIVGKIASNSEDAQAAATDMIQGPDEHLEDKVVLLGTENHNEGSDSESPNGFSSTDNNDISTCVGSGGFDVGSPGCFLLSDFGDLFNKPSCADVGINMDSPFHPPQPTQLAQPHHPPPPPPPHHPLPQPQPHSSTLQSALCTKQGNFHCGYDDDCSKSQSPIEDDNFCTTHENNISTNDHYEPVSNIAYSVQNGDTDERQHLLSEFDDVLEEPYLGVNMESTFLPPQQLAATTTSATPPGGFDVGSPHGFLLSDFGDLFNKPSCADLGINMDSPFLPPQPTQLARPPHSPQPHHPTPLPQPHSFTLQSALCTKQGNFPGGYNDDCSKRQSPIGDDNFCLAHENNISTNDHYEPVRNIAYSVQNGDTDERQHLLSEFDDVLKEPYLGVNMESTCLPAQQQAATLAATPTSATSPGNFGVGSPGGFFLSDFEDLLKEAFCANQPPHPLHLHQPPPAPHPHEPPHSPHPQNYCSSTQLAESRIKQGNVLSLNNDDCSKQLSPTVNNISTNYHYEPVSSTAYCVQNGATDERFSKVYKTSTDDHNESAPAPHPHEPPHPPHPQNYCSSALLSESCIKQGSVPSLNNNDCSKQLSPTVNNISTSYHYEPVSDTTYCVQNRATDQRFSKVYKTSTDDHNESAPAPHPHEPPHPPHPQNYCSSALLSESCIKQGSVPSLNNNDCSKQLSPTVNNISTSYHHEPVSDTTYCVQNRATDQRFSKVYKTSTNDHNESVSSEVEDNLGSLFDAFSPQDYTLLPPRNTELGDVLHANNSIDMQWQRSEKNPTAKLYHTTRLGKLQSVALLLFTRKPSPGSIRFKAGDNRVL